MVFGVLLFGARRRRSCRSAGILVLEVLFFGALVLDDVFADVLIVVVTFVFAVVDVSVAKVMKPRVFLRLSSGARSSLGHGGFKQIRLFFVLAMWRSWRAGWQAGSGDSRLEYRYSFFGCDEESRGELCVGPRGCCEGQIVEGVVESAVRLFRTRQL